MSSASEIPERPMYDREGHLVTHIEKDEYGEPVAVPSLRRVMTPAEELERLELNQLNTAQRIAVLARAGRAAIANGASE